MTDFDHAPQRYELTFIHFIATEQFDIVAKVAQEPVELPQGLRIAVESARNDVIAKSVRFQNSQNKCVIRLLCLPAEIDFLHANEEDPVRNLVGGAAIGGVQPGDLAFHAAPAF